MTREGVTRVPVVHKNAPLANLNYPILESPKGNRNQRNLNSRPPAMTCASPLGEGPLPSLRGELGKKHHYEYDI